MASMDIIKEILIRFTSTGGLNIDSIVEESGLDKTTVYAVIDRLREMNEIYENKGKYRMVNY